MIHIIHGKKRIEQKMGLVAEFCPVCHEIRCFELRRVMLFSHFYFILYGKGELVEHRVVCTVCGLWLQTKPDRYAGAENTHVYLNDIEALMQSTFPALRKEYAARLAFERQLKANPAGIDPETRARYMFEQFRVVNPQVHAAFKQETRFDRKSVLGGLGLAGLFGLLLAAALSLPKGQGQDLTATAAILLLLAASFFVLAQLALVPRRRMRTRLLPRLARGLRPFHPLEAELEALLAKCKAAGMFIAGKVTPRRLMEELDKPGARP